METKQTAVEWLVKNSYTFQKEIEAGNEHLKSKIEQAKQMEKEQIMNAFDSGYFNYQVLFHDNAEEYFKETY